LFKNLVVKQFYTVMDPEDKRVIDVNALMQKRMEESAKRPGRMEKWEAGELSGEAEGNGLSDAEAKEEAAAILERAGKEAADICAHAQNEAVEIMKNAQEKAEAEKARILEEARQQGYQDGNRKAQAEARALRQEFEEKTRQLEEAYEEQLNVIEPKLMDVITDVYEHVFNIDLGSRKEILEYLISNAIRKLEGGHEFIIHVSKDDYSYVNMQKKQILAGAVAGNSNVDVVEDLTLSKNDCMIETDGGIFDCGLGTQLSELKQKLMLLSYGG